MGIQASGLIKSFSDTLAVYDISFEVSPGEIYGLLGPNGAGKTTTLRMLAGLMRPTAGTATICGHDVQEQPLEAKALLSFVTGSTGLYERLTPAEVLRYFGQLYGVPRQKLERRIEELAEMFQMTRLMRRRCGNLSTGEKQRVSLARALVHDPPVLILDEPTSGLDVLASRFVADVIRQTRDRGRAILLSTHYMAEAELLCDRIGLVHEGHLLTEETPTELRERMEARSLEEAFLKLIDQERLS